VFGSDFPYAPAAIGASFTAKLDVYDDFSADEHRATSHGNAQALFPRLAPRKEMADAPGRAQAR
jgi:aminocarboxymuconate-semialdehyde decarboxylase